jgi:heme O synthase-like polyprenyltransferase
LSAGAWILFAILFLWQIPHSLAIARVYREDYARAGIRLLPVVEPDGASTGRQVVSYCLTLLPVGLLPTLVGLTGPVYFTAALGLGVAAMRLGQGGQRCRFDPPGLATAFPRPGRASHRPGLVARRRQQARLQRRPERQSR